VKEGDIILTPMPQADGKIKNRPAIYLREMPPFRDALVCGVSTQIHHLAADFDELITRQDSDFSASGLASDSLIRLGFLAVLLRRKILGSIGSISPQKYLATRTRARGFVVSTGGHFPLDTTPRLLDILVKTAHSLPG
jgi:mRNA interferase MazF